MLIYITKNGQRMGPYSRSEAQRLVIAGTLEPTDWAWYEGLNHWVPLHHIPGFIAPQPAASYHDEPDEPAPRPLLVWVISLFYFLVTPLSLLSLAIVPLMLSGSLAVGDSQRNYMESLSNIDYGLSVLLMLANLAGAILLFLLRRLALYVFAGAFLLSLATTIYRIASKNWLQVMGASGLAGTIIALCFNLAILGYLWHLTRKEILR